MPDPGPNDKTYTVSFDSQTQVVSVTPTGDIVMNGPGIITFQADSVNPVWSFAGITVDGNTTGKNKDQFTVTYANGGNGQPPTMKVNDPHNDKKADEPARYSVQIKVAYPSGSNTFYFSPDPQIVNQNPDK